MTIVEFLRARYDTEAQEASDAVGERIYFDYIADSAAPFVDSEVWTPKNRLREVEAKRRIVDRCATRGASHDPDADEGAWELIHDDAWATLYDLALPYADHPDYDPAWAPPNG